MVKNINEPEVNGTYALFGRSIKANLGRKYISRL